jgi:hypothetical protein
MQGPDRSSVCDDQVVPGTRVLPPTHTPRVLPPTHTPRVLPPSHTSAAPKVPCKPKFGSLVKLSQTPAFRAPAPAPPVSRDSSFLPRGSAMSVKFPASPSLSARVSPAGDALPSLPPAHVVTAGGGKVAPTFGRTKTRPSFLSRLVSDQPSLSTVTTVRRGILPVRALTAGRQPPVSCPASPLVTTATCPVPPTRLLPPVSWPALPPVSWPASPLVIGAMQPPPSSSITPNLPPHASYPAPPSPLSTAASPTASRKRPVLQTVDMAELVRQSGALGLAKVNTATLLDHLRRHGVTEAKAKSKKEQFVQMVVKLYQQ